MSPLRIDHDLVSARRGPRSVDDGDVADDDLRV